MSLTDTLSKTISASLNRYHLIIPPARHHWMLSISAAERR